MGTLKRLWIYEPVVLAWALNGGLAALLAFAVHLTGTQEAAVTTITTAVAAIITGVQARPVDIGVITGAVATIAVASGTFGLHLNPAMIAAGVSALGAVLALALRANLSPRTVRS